MEVVVLVVFFPIFVFDLFNFFVILLLDLMACLEQLQENRSDVN